MTLERGAGSDERPRRRGLEDRLARIQEILAALESQEGGLDSALRLFEEGVSEIRAARRIIQDAELRISELVGPDGAVAQSPSLPEEGDG